jgi:hypothetical protein
MKKIAIIFSVVSMFTFNTQAQGSDKDFMEEISFGLKAGLNSSNVYDSKGEDFRADSKIGFAGGAFFAIPLGKSFGIQPEILFSQKGFQGSGTILGSSYKFKRTTNFIDIPFLFALKPIEYVTILAGPQFSYLMKQKDVFENSLTTIEQENEFENDNVRKNTLGFMGGIDINVKQFVLGTRIGFDMTKNAGDGTSSTPRYKNVWLQATLAIRF